MLDSLAMALLTAETQLDCKQARCGTQVGNLELLRQLQRRAGIGPEEAGAGGGSEVEAAFAAALAEHEAKLRVQYAGRWVQHTGGQEVRGMIVNQWWENMQMQCRCVPVLYKQRGTVGFFACCKGFQRTSLLRVGAGVGQLHGPGRLYLR